MTEFYPRGARREEYDAWMGPLAPGAGLKTLRKFRDCRGWFWNCAAFWIRGRRRQRGGDTCAEGGKPVRGAALPCHEEGGGPCHGHLVRPGGRPGVAGCRVRSQERRLPQASPRGGPRSLQGVSGHAPTRRHAGSVAAPSPRIRHARPAPLPACGVVPARILDVRKTGRAASRSSAWPRKGPRLRARPDGGIGSEFYRPFVTALPRRARRGARCAPAGHSCWRGRVPGGGARAGAGRPGPATV